MEEGLFFVFEVIPFVFDRGLSATNGFSGSIIGRG